MPLADSIIALNPRWYWKLDETSGSTAHEAMGTGFDMTWSDSGGMGFIGPELGSHAARVFASATIQSPGFTFDGHVTATVLALITAPTVGATTTSTPFMGIGVPGGLNNRGFWLNQRSDQNLFLRLGANGQQTGQDTQASGPGPLWHVIAVGYDQPNGQRNLIVDSGYYGLSGGNWSDNNHNWNVGDTLWIVSGAPCVVGHVAYFPRLLLQSDVQTIAQQIQTWPYGEPINTPIPSGATVDLQPVLDGQAEILANQQTALPLVEQIPHITATTDQIQIDTQAIEQTVDSTFQDTQNIVNSLFPQLGDFLTTIMNGITTTLTGAGGAITKTIGDLFSGHTWDALTEYDFGTACAPEVLNVNLGGGTFFGITLECTAYADWYVATGPGDSYITQSLGTLEIIRGGKVVLRHGLHTLTYEVYPLPAVPFFELELATPVAPGDYVVNVVPAPETCWSLKALYFP